jgi:hypothetical protein
MPYLACHTHYKSSIFITFFLYEGFCSVSLTTLVTTGTDKSVHTNVAAHTFVYTTLHIHLFNGILANRIGPPLCISFDNVLKQNNQVHVSLKAGDFKPHIHILLSLPCLKSQLEIIFQDLFLYCRHLAPNVFK